MDHHTYAWTREHLLEVLTTGKRPVVRNPYLAKAFAEIDRVNFLPPQLAEQAYTDKDVEFAHGQTLTSPIALGHMLEALNLQPGQKVLELGTGTGYSAALISHTVAEGGFIYTVERNQQIAALARANLSKYAKISNWEVVLADGSDGLVARAPFDAIHVSFAYKDLPETLLEQLKIGGRLVLPFTDLQIKLYERIADSDVSETLLTAKDFAKVQYGTE